MPRALDSLQMGFVPVPKLDPREPSTSLEVRGKQLRVDLLTPGSDAHDAPVYIPRFKSSAAPIKFLSLLMHEAQPTAAVHAGGAVLVVVPSPGRFALHKLLVSQSRSMVQQTKTTKDLHQAACLFEALAADRPADLEAAARAFRPSGPVVTSRVLRALATVEKRWRETVDAAEIVRRSIG